MFPASFLFAIALLFKPEQRALSYLAHEVPRWSVENKCYSCHNNGDAARALFIGQMQNYAIPDSALADTTRWLASPGKWDKNGGDGPFNDKELARLQFASALLAANQTKKLELETKAPLHLAALEIAAQQHKDGSWLDSTTGSIGGSVTYGPALATCQAVSILRRADPRKFEAAISRADRWLRDLDVQTVLDAAAVLWALAEAKDAGAAAQRERCLVLIRKGQSTSGGWGPYISSGPEIFDTAIVLHALASMKATAESTKMIERARHHLLKEQKPDGSWRETTRPSDLVSYPNRVSTTAWATMALLATSGRK